MLAMAAELQQAAVRVLRSGWYVDGAEVRAFEREFADYCGQPHCAAVSSGTDALEIALRALGCGPGDEVITVANAGMYAVTACLHVGAMPVFADIDGGTLLIAPESVEKALSPRTAAVVVTHLYGKLVDVPRIARVLDGRPVAILEDCAQSHGARAGAGHAGGLGDIAAFSFYPTKNLGGLGDGGAILTHRADLAAKVGEFRQYGWTRRFVARVPYGRNSRMDEIQAAFLRAKLPKLDAWNTRRRSIVARYRDVCQTTAWHVVHEPGPDFAAHLCVVRHPRRDAAREQLAQVGIATAIHYPVPDHQQEALRGVEWRAPDLSTTERVQEEILTLPCFPELTDAEVDRVCAALREVR